MFLLIRKFILSAFFLQSLTLLSGFSLVIFPELTVSIIILGTVVIFYDEIINSFKINRDGLTFLLIILLLINFGNFNLTVFNVVKTCFSVILFQAAKMLNIFFTKMFALGAFFGITALFVFLVFPKASFKFSGGVLSWINQPNIAVQVAKDNVVTMNVSRDGQSWVLQDPVVAGPGRVRYQVEMRSDTPLIVDAFAIGRNVKKGRLQQGCNVLQTWTTCSLFVDLSARSEVTLGVGYGTWGPKFPSFQTRRPEVVLLDSPNFFQMFTWPDFVELFRNNVRFSGRAFNENAFASQISLSGLLIFLAMPFNGFSVVSLAFSVYVLVFSGSRASIVALVMGVFVFVLFRSFWLNNKKLFFSVLVCIFSSLIFFMMDKKLSVFSFQQSEIRAFNFGDQVTTQNRIEIWRLALKVWQRDTHTFYFGSGDVTSAMKAQYDKHSSDQGLVKDSLTHAHNLWLQTAGESGLVGLLAMTCLWVWAFFRAFRTRNAPGLAILIAVFVINLVDYLFFYAPVYLLFWAAFFGGSKRYAAIGDQRRDRLASLWSQ